MPDDTTGVSETIEKDIFEFSILSILLRGEEDMLETDEKLEILKLLFESGIQPKGKNYFENKFEDEKYKKRKDLILKLNEKFIQPKE